MSMTYEEAVAFLNNVLSDDDSVKWKEYPIINPEFDKNDIRSRVKIGWFVFAEGYVSPDKDAFPNCQGVIGIINDDPNAKEGNLVKVVLRHQKDMIKWCEKKIYTEVTDLDNGRENTKRLLEYGKKKGICFPAMEFARDYNYDGVKAGEAYVPAANELNELSKNFKAIDDALRQIGSSFNYYYWSSSENIVHTAWTVSSSDGYVSCYSKYDSYAVSCLLDY